jgi:sulfate/thiosulfate transport system substrate-binding protein
MTGSNFSLDSSKKLAVTLQKTYGRRAVLGGLLVSTVSTGFIVDRAIASRQDQYIAQAGGAQQITLVSYAVTSAAYSKIIPEFVAKWKKETGQTVTIRTSYAGSGTQTRAVIDGLEADVLGLALAGDIDKVQKAGLINPGWQKDAPNNSIITRSVIAIETRDGNPKKIQKWSDLIKPGVSVITANPKTSGGAKWNFLGVWGAIPGDAQARAFAARVLKNVPIFPKDAREASDVFYKKGQGDVLLNYENEVILAAQQGKTKPSYVIPEPNISIDGPIAVVDKVVDKRRSRKVSEAFVKFLFTPEAQREFAAVGFRPVDSTVTREFANRYPKVAKLNTVQTFGGWDAVDKKFFANGAIFDQLLAGKR